MHREYEKEFAKSLVDLSVEEEEFGYLHGIISDTSLERLGHLYPKSRIKSDPWTVSHEVWRMIALHWAILNIHNYEDLFDEINSIYACFDYPEDMKTIVSFMPGDETSSPNLLREKIIAFTFQRKSLVSKLRGSRQ